MAQKAVESATKQEESTTSKIQKTFSRIEQMEQKFQSLKNLYHQNLQSLADKIKMEVKNNRTNDQKTQDENPTSTARPDSECEEFFDNEETLKIKIKKLATLVKKSKHFVAFTGAGISTSAGIADFRSGTNTVLNTGTGKWAKKNAIKKGKNYKTGSTKVNTIKALPTISHMALVGLMQNGAHYLKYLISQNTDGLHRRSGIDIEKLSELHGNSTLEVCTRCNKAYMRDYICRGSIRTPLTVYDHFTGRYCTVSKCNGQLKDTIINFGEPPHEMALDSAMEHSEKADLFLSLGSSLTVAPACDLPERVGVKWNHEVNNEMDKEVEHDLVIVNLQKTDLDYLCSLRIFARIDVVMLALMKELEMDIPKWYLQRFVSIGVQDLENRGDLRKLTVCGVDIDGTNFSMFMEVKLSDNGKKIMRVGLQRRMSLENLMVLAKKNKKSSNYKHRKDEFVFNIQTISMLYSERDEKKKNDMDCTNNMNKGLELELSFYGHYNETRLVIELNEYLNHLSDENGCIVLKMEFDPSTKEWHVGNKREQLSDKNVKKLWSNYNEKRCDKVLINPYELRHDD